MLDFRGPRRSAVRSFSARRERLRLLLLVASLGIVILVLRQARRQDAVNAVSRLFGEPAVADELRPQEVATKTLSAEAPVSQDGAVEIRDNAPFRSAEQAAWFQYLAAAQRLATAAPANNRAVEATYVQLVAQPNVYRGRLVVIRGTVRRATAERPAANDLCIESYYRLIVQPAGGARPIFVYCLQLPNQFPRGEQVEYPVTVVGYFFKNLSYQTEEGPEIAPIVVADEPSSAEVDLAETVDVSSPASTVAANENGEPDRATASAGDHKEFDEIMQLAGWNAERWHRFADDAPIGDAERVEIAQLLFRLRTLDGWSLNTWAGRDVPASDLFHDPETQRGQLLYFAGRVRRVVEHALSAENAERYDMPSYFECEFDLASDAGAAIVFATRVPRAWPMDSPIDEPAAFAGVFIKRSAPPDEADAKLLFVAGHVGWYPTEVSEPAVNFGESLLGRMGVDIGLLDSIQQHVAIRPEEREAFYAVLAVQDQLGAHQLARFATNELDLLKAAWSEQTGSPDPARAELAREVLKRAKEGRFSVAPLFNDAEDQVGRLVVVDGVARRAIRVDIVPPAGDASSDVVGHFGMDHYYELDVFTDDSQNRPIVFCVRELPPGFPIGSDMHVAVRVAGFFFKSWHYQTQGTRDAASGERQSDAQRGLISPLLIGRAPILLETETNESMIATPVAVGLFLIAFGAVWGLAWWYSRDARRFRELTLAPVLELPDGPSLDSLGSNLTGGDSQPNA